MLKWYFTSILIAQIIVFPLFFAGIKSAWLIGLLLFFNQLFGQGVSGLAPRWVSSYFPVEQRAAGVGFIYNVAMSELSAVQLDHLWAPRWLRATVWDRL